MKETLQDIKSVISAHHIMHFWFLFYHMFNEKIITERGFSLTRIFHSSKNHSTDLSLPVLKCVFANYEKHNIHKPVN